MFTLYLHKNHTELLINILFLLCLDLSVARYKNLLSNRMKALQIFGFTVKTPKLASVTALLWVGRCCQSFTMQTYTCRNGSLDLLLFGARLQSGAEHAGKRLHQILFWPTHPDRYLCSLFSPFAEIGLSPPPSLAQPSFASPCRDWGDVAIPSPARRNPEQSLHTSKRKSSGAASEWQSLSIQCLTI